MICHRLYLFADHYIEGHILYELGLHVLCLVLIYDRVKLTSYERIQEKVQWLYILGYYVLALLFFCFVQYKSLQNNTPLELINGWGNELAKSAASRAGLIYYILGILCVPTITFIIYFVLSYIIKVNNLTSERLNDRDIFLFIIKPRNLMGLLTALFKRTPISGMFVYTNDVIYCFKKGSSQIQKIAFSDKININNYLVLNTGKIIQDNVVNLSNLENTEWSFKNNCVTAFPNLLKLDVFKLIRERVKNCG